MHYQSLSSVFWIPVFYCYSSYSLIQRNSLRFRGFTALLEGEMIINKISHKCSLELMLRKLDGHAIFLNFPDYSLKKFWITWIPWHGELYCWNNSMLLVAWSLQMAANGYTKEQHSGHSSITYFGGLASSTNVNTHHTTMKPPSASTVPCRQLGYMALYIMRHT